MENLTKERTIELWNSECDKIINISELMRDESISNYSYYGIVINETVSILISKTAIHHPLPHTSPENKLEIKILFDSYVEYKTFEISETEFQALLNKYVETENRIRIETTNKIKLKGEKVLESILN